MGRWRDGEMEKWREYYSGSILLKGRWKDGKMERI
jgi:hypothetical protein